MRWVKIIFLLSLALSAGIASAQVHRCKDAAGKLIFSDRPCATEQSGELIRPKRSQQAILQEREQAYNAERLKQDRRLLEQERDSKEQQRRAAALMPAPVAGGGASTWQQSNELRNARVSASSITSNGGAWDGRAQKERSKQNRQNSQPAPPSTITHCDPGFCYDDSGGVYHKVGPDFMTGPNGSACHRAGNMWNCN